MNYSVRINPNRTGNYVFHNATGQSFFITNEAIILTTEQLGLEGLRSKRLECIPIIEGPVIVTQPESTSSAGDITQSAEVADPTPDFETYTRPTGKKRGKRR